MDAFLKVTKYLETIPVIFLLTITFALGLCLFLPTEFARTLGVEAFRREYRIFLGPGLILTLSFLGARFFNLLWERKKEKQNLKELQESLNHLTPEEKGYLAVFIHEQKNTINVGLDDGIMQGLKIKKIVYRASNQGNVMEGFPFNLQPWAREYLDKHPQLLEGHCGKPETPIQKVRGPW